MKRRGLRLTKKLYAKLQAQGRNALAQVKPVGSKMRNRHTVVDGITFDSAKEAKRYRQLRMLKTADGIRKLEVHIRVSI